MTRAALIMLLLTVAITALPACDSAAPADVVATVSVDGMHCQSCVASIEQAVTTLPGISACQVSLDDGTATIDADSEDALAAAKAKIASLGFQVENDSGR